MNRAFNVTTVFGSALRFSSLRGHEEISRLFELTLLLKSEQKSFDPQAILGTPVTLEMELAGGARRHLNGQCMQFAQVGKHGRHYLYQALLKPWLWYGTRRSDYRIFQNMTAPDMVKQVLGQYPFPTRYMLTRNYRLWEYCVQYRESDANFVMRMLENEGIWFWFEHSAGEHVMVISDDIGLCNPYPGYASLPFTPDVAYPGQDHLDVWSAGGALKPGQYMTHDYNFTMPRSDLAVRRDQSPGHAHGSYEIFDYPGGYTNLSEGEAYARVRTEELQSSHLRGQATGFARGLAPGYLFSLEKHPDAAQNREYLIVAAHYQFTDNDYEATHSSDELELRIQVETHPSNQPFRPQRLTPKPQTSGPDTATVTGPQGQEIYTDEFARVKVSFPWNRYCSKDENSSCWIRVSSPWAGSNFGGIQIPRIGQEVLVDYLNGDPDRPVITSRLYNAFQMPPWQLPGNATQSGFLTRSSLGGGYENANALRFEDKKGEEQLWIHAEKNQDIEVEHDETHWVGNDRSKTIDRDETSHIKRDRTETVDRDETITVHGNRKEEVDGNETIDIHKNRTETVDGHETITVHKNRTETVDGNEKISVHGNRTKTVDGNETDRIGKSWSIQVGRNKTETISLASLQNVGLGKMVNIGAAYNLNVGMMMVSNVGLSRTDHIGQSHNASVGKSYSLTVGGGGSGGGSAAPGVGPKHIVAPSGQSAAADGSSGSGGSSLNLDGSSIKLSSDTIDLRADSEITLRCGQSIIRITPSEIEILSPKVDINC